MTTRIISFAMLAAIAVSLSCRPKAAEQSGTAGNPGSPREENMAQSDSAIPAVAKTDTVPGQAMTHPEQAEAIDPVRPSYGNLRKDMEDALARIPPPRNREEDDAAYLPVRKMYERRRNLLFSIPVSPRAERDRGEAWSKLEQKGYFNDEQYRYAKNLLKTYSEAPQIEKLVIWEVVRISMNYSRSKGGGGGLGEVGTSEDLLKFEMARLLLPALGIDQQELFDAASLQQKKASDEAWSKGVKAEEEIERIYIEQSKVAEQILEKHWKLPP